MKLLSGSVTGVSAESSIRIIAGILIASLLPWAASAQVINSSEIDEIIVSVRKTDESLQEVPIAVSVFGAEQIDKQRLQTLSDVAINTPSLQFDTGFWPSDTRISIRGLFARAGRPSAAVLIDGIDAMSESLQSSGGSALLNQRLLNIERIEVARGPQSALYGRGAFSGAVNYITRRPGNEWGGNLVVDGASGADGAGNRTEIRGVVEGPITDSLSFSALASSYQLDGWYRNGLNGERVGGGDSNGVGLAFNWEPSESFDAYLNITYSVDKFDPQAVVLVRADTLRKLDPSGNLVENASSCSPSFIPGVGDTCLPVVTGKIKANGDQINLSPDPRTFNVDAANPNPQDGSNYKGTDDETLRTNLILNWDLGWGNLRSSTSVVDATNKIFLDTTQNYGAPDSFLPEPPGPPAQPTFFTGNYTDANYEFEFKQFYQEFQLSGANDSGFQWLAGLNGFWEEATDQNNSSIWYRDNQICENGIFPIIPADAVPCDFLATSAYPAPQFDKKQVRDTTSVSAFGLLGFDLSDAVKLTLEGRLIYDKVEIEGNTSDTLAQILSPTVPPRTYPGSPGFKDSIDDTNFVPRVSLDWFTTDNVMLYGSIAQGIKPPTFFATDMADPSLERVKKEKLTTYEIGTKTQWLDRTLTFNGALYYNDYKDQQVRVQFPPPAGQFIPRQGTSNAGKVTVYGLEIDSSWTPNEHWNLGFSYAYTKGEYDDFNLTTSVPEGVIPSNTDRVKAGNPEADYTGNDTPGVPNHAFSLVGQYRHAMTANMDWYAGASWNWQDDRFADTANLVTLESYSLVNAQVGLQTDSWFLALYAENLFDDDTVRFAQEFIDQTEGLRGDLGSAFPVGYYAYLPQPRTIGLKFNYRTN